VLAVDGRAIAGMTAAERVRDLVPFSVSQRYSGLRSALGVAARLSFQSKEANINSKERLGYFILKLTTD